MEKKSTNQKITKTDLQHNDSNLKNNEEKKQITFEDEVIKNPRYSTAAIGTPILLLAYVFMDDIVNDIFMAVVAIFLMYEYCHCFHSTKKANPSSWYMYIVCGAIAFIHFVPIKYRYQVLFGIIPFSLLILFMELIFMNGKKNVIDIAVTILGIIYIPLMIVFLSLLRGMQNGKILIGYAFCAAWGSDCFAYLIGKFFGKHKLTPISPKKTVEGSIGGIFGAVLLAIIYNLIIRKFVSIETYIPSVASIVISLSIIGQFGDLAASSIKRYCGIKDFSQLLPGHGGMLDRVDSLLFIAPFAYILLGMI